MSPVAGQPRGGVLAANVDAPLAGRAASTSTRTWAASTLIRTWAASTSRRTWPILLALVVLGGVASLTLAGFSSTRLPAASVVAYEGQDIGGSAIVHDCFQVDDQQCLTASPALHKALEKLASTSEGPTLLRTAARAGIALRIGSVASKADVAFDPKTRSVTVNAATLDMGARGQAAVLANMLRFVSTWSGPAGILPRRGLTCIQEETSALATELAVWKQLRGDGPPPSDRLETTEDRLARAMDGRGVSFWLEQAMAARARCG